MNGPFGPERLGPGGAQPPAGRPSRVLWFIIGAAVVILIGTGLAIALSSGSGGKASGDSGSSVWGSDMGRAAESPRSHNPTPSRDGFPQVASVFGQAAIERGVMTVLDDNGFTVTKVTCPARVTVKVATTFTCQAEINGVSRDITSKITSADGNYEVTLPSG